MKQPILLTLLAAPALTLASEWAWVAQSDDKQDNVLVDISSIKINADVRQVWERLVPSPHTMKGAGDNAHKWLKYEVSRVAFNCADETDRTEAITAYYDDGSIENLLPEVLSQSWKPVVPDTLERREMQFVCEWKPK
jgi:hypothetical protein